MDALKRIDRFEIENFKFNFQQELDTIWQKYSMFLFSLIDEIKYELQKRLALETPLLVVNDFHNTDEDTGKHKQEASYDCYYIRTGMGEKFGVSIYIFQCDPEINEIALQDSSGADVYLCHNIKNINQAIFSQPMLEAMTSWLKDGTATEFVKESFKCM